MISFISKSYVDKLMDIIYRKEILVYCDYFIIDTTKKLLTIYIGYSENNPKRIFKFVGDCTFPKKNNHTVFYFINNHKLNHQNREMNNIQELINNIFRNVLINNNIQNIQRIINISQNEENLFNQKIEELERNETALEEKEKSINQQKRMVKNKIFTFDDKNSDLAPARKGDNFYQLFNNFRLSNNETSPVESEYIGDFDDEFNGFGKRIKKVKETGKTKTTIGDFEKGEPKGFIKEMIIEIIEEDNVKKTVTFGKFNDYLSGFCKEIEYKKDFKKIIFEYKSLFNEVNEDNETIINELSKTIIDTENYDYIYFKRGEIFLNFLIKNKNGEIIQKGTEDIPEDHILRYFEYLSKNNL